MLKTVIVLPDGTEVSSGIGARNNIRSVTVTERVNSETELTLGSVCASMVEATLQTPAGGLSIGEGSEITLYREDASGKRNKVGLFTLEKPQRPSANTYKLTAYDRISWLDRDLTDWLAGLQGFPYPLLDFAKMVAGACGLTLKNKSLLNGSYRVQRFSGQGITGRKLMEWIGQLCAKFCRATPEGEIEFAWYENRYAIALAPSAFTQEGKGYEVTCTNERLSISSPAVQASGSGTVKVTGLAVVSDDGDGNLVLAVDDGQRTGIGYFQGGLSYEDYAVAPIEKVQLRLTEDDVGTACPQVTGAVNTYIITGNYLLTGGDSAALQAVAERIYNAIAHVRYTPCKVSLPGNFLLRAGDAVQITDANGKRITAYIMSKVQKGQRDTLECTGSARRDSPEAVNSESFRSVSGKLLEVRKSIEGLNIKATALGERIDGNTKVLTEKIAEVDVKADGISASVSSLDKKVDSNNSTLSQNIAAVTARTNSLTATVQSLQKRVSDNEVSTSERISEIEQNADGITASVKNLKQKVDYNEAYMDTQFSEIALDTKGITASVSSVQQQVVQNQDTVNKQISQVSGKIDNVAGDTARNTEEIETVKTSVTTVKQTADGVSLEVQKIRQNGVSKVTTGMGYTFDENGLKIRKPGEEIANLLDNTGMYVTRSGTVILQANAAGVTATDVKVNNYLIVGEHARFEDYSNGTDTKRTGCFWI